MLAQNLFGSACSGQYFMSEIELELKRRSKFCLQWSFVGLKSVWFCLQWAVCLLTCLTGEYVMPEKNQKGDQISAFSGHLLAKNL